MVSLLSEMKKAGISGLPVSDNQRLVGILTNRDLRFEENLGRKVREVMTHEELAACGDPRSPPHLRPLKLESHSQIEPHRPIDGRLT